MELPRVQWFEFNDAPWAPAVLRETVIETLSRTLAWGRVLRGLVDPFRAFIAATRATAVLDLCAGAGGPASILVDEITRAGATPPHFLLTDLQPQRDAWSRIRAAHPEHIDFVPERVDATNIPPSLGAGRVRSIINALHHFPPPLASAILRGACEGAEGVFVAEGFERNPLRFGSFAPAGLAALLANPVLAPRRNLAKVALTWATPVALGVSIWDGLVSTMRVYSEAELRAMVAPFGAEFEWRYGRYDFAPGGRGYYFYGVRRR